MYWFGLRCGAFGWGNAVQAGRSRLSLEFFIDLILPTALCPRGRLSLQQKWVPGIFRGGKGCRCVGLTSLPHPCADCLEIWETERPGTLRPVIVLMHCSRYYAHCLKKMLELASLGSLTRVTSNKHVSHCMSKPQCGSKYYTVNGFPPPFPSYLIQ